MELNPQQLHYFKRELISQQLDKEVDTIRKSTQLSSLVQPTPETSAEYPFLQYLTKHFVLEFPLLKNGKEADFFTKLQVFLDEYSKLQLDNYAPKSSRDSQRRVLLYKVQKLLIISLCASIKSVQGTEESIDILNLATKSTDPNESLASKLNMTHLESEEEYLEWIGMNGLKLNVVTVRDISEVRTIRQHVHTEFIVETEIQVAEGEEKVAPVYVARRHGAFKALRDALKVAYPTLELPSVPSKARDAGTKAHLHREKDRIMLRSFLRRLASEAEVANSTIFRDFLLENPIQLNEVEVKDAEIRHKMDQNRIDEEKRFREQVDQKIVELDGLLDMLKKKIMKPNGLLEIFGVIKTTEKIQDLPVELQKAFEWGRINLAFVLHTQFVTSDRSIENIANLKRTHSLMPYRTVAQILKLSNPFSMVKSVLDLFLAQPLGSKSLFQRIVLANMNDQTKELQKDIEELQIKINDPPLCLKIANAVKSEVPDNVVDLGHTSSILETLELLKNPAIEPILTPQQILKVAFANQPGKADAQKLVTDLHKLWILYARKQEQEVMTSLVFQGVTGEIIKDLFAIFYEPLAQVYKAANIGDTIGHVAGFINDLIAILDKLDAEDATNTTQPFIDLVQAHEAEFYAFVHNVHAQDQSKLFDNLLGYVDSMFSFVANGIPQRIDLDAIVNEAGITKEEYPALIKEIDDLCAYHFSRKQRHLERKRQKLLSADDVQDTQETFDFLPDNKEVIGVMNDMAEVDYDSEDDLSETGGSSSNLIAHEMTLKRPVLTLIPRIAPTFVKHVRVIMQ